MMWLTENIQACLRIFRRAQHQWLARDICIKRKGFLMFLSYTHHRSTLMRSLSCGVLPSRQMLLIGLYPRALPPVTQGSALQAPERLRGTSDAITLQAPERL